MSDIPVPRLVELFHRRVLTAGEVAGQYLDSAAWSDATVEFVAQSVHLLPPAVLVVLDKEISGFASSGYQPGPMNPLREEEYDDLFEERGTRYRAACDAIRDSRHFRDVVGSRKDEV